ncbi:MAG: hypothetical protein J0H41_04740 [Rhizobiales bacterium]|nr:hypothetical protein [Hyphomicrobiales bacterium]
MRPLIPMTAALLIAAAAPAFAATTMHSTHARAQAHRPVMAHTMTAPAQPANVNIYKQQDTIISHVVGVPG